MHTITGLFEWSKISRRGFLLATAAIPGLKGQHSSPSCVLASEQEEGPYYIDGAAVRSDITEGKIGMPLTLRIALVDARSCTPLSNAAVDVWHCDAEGVYSGFVADGRGASGRGAGPRGGRDGMPPPPSDWTESFGPRMPPPPPAGRGPRRIDRTRFLRGVQISNQQGTVQFVTVYPGWYDGRAIHIHMKVHLGGDRAADSYAGGHVSHTGQLFFPEDVTEGIAKMQPYAKRLSVHRTTQEQDGVFASQHGASSLVQMERFGSSSIPAGFVATATLAVDPDLTPGPARRGPGGPPPFPR
jgi:protocatechuate 3,4-dioxygenase beta subunit